MAKNFKIETNGTNQTFYFDLIGDFDGSSAFELLNLLTEKVTSAKNKVVINTTRLKTIHPFGRDVFSRNFSRIEHGRNIVFTGLHAAEIAPVEKMKPSRRQELQQRLPFLQWLEAPSYQANPQPMPGGE